VQSKEIWPGRGQHILAQYDDDSVLVYQAFNKGSHAHHIQISHNMLLKIRNFLGAHCTTPAG
jgi:hypothetical protein